MARKTVQQIEVEELPPVALTKDGAEIPDPTPLEIPAGFKIPETAEQRIQRMVRHSMSEWAARNEAETFEEADDFDISDDEDPTSPYETHFDPVLGRDLSAAEFQARESVIKQRYVEAHKRYWEDVDRLDAMRNPAGRFRKREDRGAGGGQPPASTPPVRPTPEDSGGK